MNERITPGDSPLIQGVSFSPIVGYSAHGKCIPSSDDESDTENMQGYFNELRLLCER